MAKSARGLPDGFSLDLPDEKPILIGDFLDEEPPAPVVRKTAPRRLEAVPVESPLRAAVVIEPVEVPRKEPVVHPAARPQPTMIRYQLNLTPKSKVMLDELVEQRGDQ